MRLLLADDHSLFRDALVQYIERAEPDAHVVLARDVHEVMEVVDQYDDIDLILLDLRMPGMNGLQGLEKLRQKKPDIPVVMISGLAEKADVDEAMAMGAAGYFPKTMSGKALMGGIRRVLSGEVFLARDHNTNEVMPSYYNGQPAADEAVNVAHGFDKIKGGSNDDFRLTPREKEVLSHLLRGASNKEIARSLDLQVVTVKLHVRSICRKMGAENRTQAALIAQRQGL